jgi:hypothetical protein
LDREGRGDALLLGGAEKQGLPGNRGCLAPPTPPGAPPGAEAEVDFGDVTVELAGQLARCFLFAFRLSCSGKGVHRVCASQAQEAFFEGQAPSGSAASAAQAPGRCSQLSGTSSSSAVRSRYRSAWITGVWPVCRTPRAAITCAETSPGSVMPASPASHTRRRNGLLRRRLAARRRGRDLLPQDRPLQGP